MPDKGVQVIDRMLDILELLTAEKDGLGVTEIGNRLKLHKSTVYRILSSLAERGYIEKNPITSYYRIGLKLVELSSIYLSNVELKTEARPYLWELATRLNMATHLAILDGADAIYIEKVDISSSTRLYSQIGRRIPAYCSALGKSLLSGLPDQLVAETAQETVYTRYTANTITDPRQLIEEVKQVRLRGWSLDNEEHDPGIRCLGAPIFDYRGNIIAALSISGSSANLPKQKDLEIGRLVAETGLMISKRLGYKR